MCNHFSNFGGLPYGFGSIISLVILGIVIYIVIRAISGRKNTPNHLGDRYDSLEILKVRLARGEISSEEFERLKGYLQAQF